MADRVQAKRLGGADGVVAAGIVNENHFIDKTFGDVGDGLRDGFLRVVGGHDDDQFVPMNHAAEYTRRTDATKRCQKPAPWGWDGFWLLK